MATRESWTVIICKSQTESPWVKVWLDSPDGNHDDKEQWVYWTAIDETPNWFEHDIDPKWHAHGKIWVYAHGADDHNIHMAITYKGDTKKVMDFDSGNGEEHVISKTDGNVDFQCR